MEITSGLVTTIVNGEARIFDKAVFIYSSSGNTATIKIEGLRFSGDIVQLGTASLTTSTELKSVVIDLIPIPIVAIRFKLTNTEKITKIKSCSVISKSQASVTLL